MSPVTTVAAGRPAPPVPSDVDLRDFKFMPLDVLRLRDSDLSCVEDAEVFRCSVLSWCVSWHQTPAASLPDDDALLARLLGFGRDVPRWKAVREAGGLRGWVLCGDGRLYHPVVAEKALDAWRGKLQQRWRTEAARLKKHNQRHALKGSAEVRMPDFDCWVSIGCPAGQPLPVLGTSRGTGTGRPEAVPSVSRSKGQGEGQGERQGQGEEKAKKSLTASSARTPTLPPCPLEDIVAAYHEALPSLPRCRLMPANRQRALRKVWSWVLTSTKADGSRRAETSEQALQWFRDYFARASENDWLMGRTPRTGEHANWEPSLDFLLTDKGMTHVIERTKEAA